MAVGKLVKFDEARGFGFIAPVGGKEDVFLHVNDLMIPESLMRPGAMLEFDIDEGERGLKAFNVSLLDNDASVQERARTVTAPIARVAAARPAVPAAAEPAVPVAGNPPATAETRGAEDQGDGDEFCDLLTPAELSNQITEMLLVTTPSLSADQVLTLRGQLTDFAKNHGWLAP